MLIPRWLGARHLPANTAAALSLVLAPSQPIDPLPDPS